MARKKVSELTEKVTLDGTELAYVVHDPSGTPADRYATTQAIAELASIPTIASQAEAEAGSDNTKMMTPLRTAQALAAQLLASYNAQVGTTYTLDLSDAGLIVELANASAITLTIPAEASVDFPVGTLIGVRQTGAGTVTIAGAGGVTVNSLNGNLALAGQWVTVTLEKRASDSWLVTGALA